MAPRNMISVDQALTQILSLISCTGVETVPLQQAAGRILAQDISARRDQPPFAAASMDGYAVSETGDLPIGSKWQVIGESAAGHRFQGDIAQAQAVRIFTGAPLPPSATKVIIQEDMNRQGDWVELCTQTDKNPYIRPRGYDFKSDFQITAPKRITPADIALLSAMNVADVPVRKQPTIAVLATGDELVNPGENPNDDQIISSNTYGLSALLAQFGAQPRIMPIAKDTANSIQTALSLAHDADLIVTIGGASVGDHDLVAVAAMDMGLQQNFYKVAMRPGKPLMAGVLNGTPMIGLPGNPVSAMVCGMVFLKPVIRKFLDEHPFTDPPLTAPLAAPLPANGPRQHYMRAQFDGQALTAHTAQDSALLSILQNSNALLIRPPHWAAAKAGDLAQYVLI